MNKIFIFVDSLRRIIFKRILQFLILIGFISIIFGELLYINNYIVKSSRDLGTLKFANAIHKLGVKGNLFYLEASKPFLLYQFADEGIIFEMAAMGNNRDNSLKLATVKGLNEISAALKSFYVAKSPYIPQGEFEVLCKRYHLICKSLVDSPVINFLFNNPPKDNSFRLYFIIR